MKGNWTYLFCVIIGFICAWFSAPEYKPLFWSCFGFSTGILFCSVSIKIISGNGRFE